MQRLVILCLWALPALAAQQPRALPDAAPFLAAVRLRLQPDEERQAGYMYVETRRNRKLDGEGRTVRESVMVLESYPGFPGEPRWERFISEDGKPKSSADLEWEDQQRQKKAEAYLREAARETTADRAKREREQENARRERADRIDDVFRVFDMKLIGREVIEGHDTILVSLTPRPGAAPKTREGRLIRHFRGRVWLSESEHELVRIEVEAIDTASFGWGIARIHQGTTFAFSRRKINGEIWLPATVEYSLSARILLVKRMREAGSSEFSGYRKFGVDTAAVFGNPPAP